MRLAISRKIGSLRYKSESAFLQLIAPAGPEPSLSKKRGDIYPSDPGIYIPEPIRYTSPFSAIPEGVGGIRRKKEKKAEIGAVLPG